MLLLSSTYTANLAAFLSAPQIVLLGPRTFEELSQATVCIRNTVLTGLILPYVGRNAPNPLSVAEQADPVLTEQWTREALLRGDCDAIAEVADFATFRLLEHCDTFWSPTNVEFAEHPPYFFMRGNTSAELAFVRKLTDGMLKYYPTRERVEMLNRLTGRGQTCPPGVHASHSPVYLPHISLASPLRLRGLRAAPARQTCTRGRASPSRTSLGCS